MTPENAKEQNWNGWRGEGRESWWMVFMRGVMQEKSLMAFDGQGGCFMENMGIDGDFCYFVENIDRDEAC